MSHSVNKHKAFFDKYFLPAIHTNMKKLLLLTYITTLSFAQIPTSNLSLWLRADAGVTTTAGNAITAWQDQSTFNLPISINNIPRLVSNNINGYPVVSLSGSAYFSMNNASLLVTPSRLTYFVVARYSNTNAAGIFSTDANNYGLYKTAGGNSNSIFYLNNSGSNAIQYPNTVGTNYIYSGKYDLSSITGKINTTVVSSLTYSTPINGAGNTFYLGYSSFANFLNGAIAEVIIYNGALNNTQEQQVYDYLSGKYNIGIHPNAPQIANIGTKTSYFDSFYEGTRVAASGFGGSGDEVTIVGTNFSSVTGLSVNNISISGFTINNNNLITFTLPDGLNYVGQDFTGKIKLTNSFGPGISTQDLQVIYSNSAPSTVIDVAQGGQFSIEGSDLSQLNSISVGGINATFVYNSILKNIIVNVSTLIGLGNKTVRVSQNTYLGNQFFDFANPINVVSSLPSPIITSVSPSKGVLGSNVIINGTGFSETPSDNVVYFGATSGLVTSSSTTTIAVQAPAGLSYQNISLTNQNSGLQTQSNPTYTHTFAGEGVITTNSFAPEVLLATGNFYGNFSTVADLNNDGKPELINSFKYASSRIGIFQNNATNNTITSASFGSVFYLTTSNQSYQIIAKDFNNDGKLDLAVYNYGGTIQVFRNIHIGGNLSASSFASPVNYTVPTGGYALDATDIDADGKIDLVVAAHSVNNNLYILKNQFIGNTLTGTSFAAPVTISFGTGAYPVDLKLVDIDGDGKVDISTANQNNSGNSSISLFRNIGTLGVINASTFATPITISLPNTFNFSTPTDPERLNSLEWADFDNDGKLDLVATNRSINSISVFKNKTLGTILGASFNERYDFATSNTPQGLAVGDINGDGKIDVAVASEGENFLYVFRNQSVDGTLTGSSFAQRLNLPTTYGNNTQPQIVDLDNDSKPDLVLLCWGQSNVSVFRNLFDTPSSITGFTPTSGLPLSRVTVFGSNFQNVTQAQMGTVTGGAVLEKYSNYIVVRIPIGATTNQIRLLNVSGSAGISATTFVVSGSTPFAVITAVSPMFAPLGGTVNVFGSGFDVTPSLNNIWFGATKMPVISATANQLVVSVAGGASSSKIAYQNSYGLNDQWKLPFGYSFSGGNLTAGSFTNNATLNTGSQPYNVISHDLDGDGKPDLIATNYNTSSNNLSIYRNNSVNNTINGTSFSAPFNLSGYSLYAFQTSVGDLDGDGKSDILVPCYNSNYFTLIKNNCTPSTLTAASFGAKNDIIVSSGYRSYGSAIADMDNDGLNDLILSSYNSGGVFIYRNLGNGSFNASGFQYVNFWNTGGNPTVIQITDIDGDGRKDIAVGNTSTTYFSIFRNISSVPGSINLATRVDVATPNTPYGIAIADINGDGKPEIMASNYSSNQVSVFQNNTNVGTISGGLFARVDFSTSINPYGIHAGDLDGDGKPEIVVTSQSELQYSIFKIIISLGISQQTNL